MNEWKAKYMALRQGISSLEYVENAEKIVTIGQAMASSGVLPFDEIMYGLLDVVRAQDRVVIPGLRSAPTWRKRIAAQLVYLAARIAKAHIQIKDFSEWSL